MHGCFGYGKESDGGNFARSSLFDHLETLNVPPPRALLGTDIILPHVSLGDESYPLKTYSVAPYPHRNVNSEEEALNRVHLNVRKVAECAFGVVCAK